MTGGNTVSVTVTVNGVAGLGDWLMGNGSDNTINGTPNVDTFVVSQGGNDTINALANDDIIYFGGALTADDNVTGAAGIDTVVLQGDYSGGLVLDGSVVGIERISMLAGTNTFYGDPGTNLYDYVITTHDANFVAADFNPSNPAARINGAALLAGEDFTFDGSAETDVNLVVYGGRGTDDLTGGAKNDIFFFAEGGRFAAGDVVDGGDGYDGLFLRGNYTIDFTQAGYAGPSRTWRTSPSRRRATSATPAAAAPSSITASPGTDDLLASGETITINGVKLQSEESMASTGPTRATAISSSSAAPATTC